MTITPSPTPDWNGVPVRWRGVLIDGTPITGSIEFKADAATFLDDDPTSPVLIFSGPIAATLSPSAADADGRIWGLGEVILPASDDPDITPNGITYTVTEKLTNAAGRTYSIEVPLAMADTGIELARVAPVSPNPGEGLSVVTVAEFSALVAQVDDLGTIDGGSSA